MLNLRPKIRALALGILVMVGFPQPSTAQSYPSRKVTVVVPWVRLSSSDIIGHLISTELTKRLKREFLIENPRGDGGNLGARIVAAAAPDGYTLLVTNTALAVNATASKTKGFEIGDLRPVAIVAYSPFVLAVNPGNSAKTLKEFVTNANAKTFNYGSTPGTITEIHAEYFFNHIAKVEYKSVVFQSATPAITAALDNRVDAVVQTLTLLSKHIQNGRLRGLGVASEKRNSAIPAVPTYSEMGFPNLYSGFWHGIFAPAGTPDTIVAKLNAEINVAMKEPSSLRILKGGGFDPMTKNVNDTEVYFKSEVEQWGFMVKATGFSN
jgi:tripartite-type tricarboxylate transporter receptor subunit TctC